MLRVRAKMPGDVAPRPERGALWWFGIAGLVVLAAWTAWTTIVDAGHPSGYRGGHLNGAVWVYPRAAVIQWLGAMAGELVILGFFVQLPARFSIGARSLLMSLLVFASLVVMAPLAMHAGTPIIEHLRWLLFASLWLFLFSVIAAVATLMRNDRRQERILRDQRAQLDKPQD